MKVFSLTPVTCALVLVLLESRTWPQICRYVPQICLNDADDDEDDGPLRLKCKLCDVRGFSKGRCPSSLPNSPPCRYQHRSEIHQMKKCFHSVALTDHDLTDHALLPPTLGKHTRSWPLLRWLKFGTNSWSHRKCFSCSWICTLTTPYSLEIGKNSSPLWAIHGLQLG